MSTRRPTLRGRLRFMERSGEEGAEQVVEIDPTALDGIFASPKWMRDLGYSSWLLVGFGAALVAAVWLLSLTQVIVMPVLTAAIIASVTAPIVDWLHERKLPRALGAVFVFLAIFAVAVLVALAIMAGISSEASSLSSFLRDAASSIQSWLEDAGVHANVAADAKAGASSGLTNAFQALTQGLLVGVDKLASLAIFLSFAALSLFFMLKDAPTIANFLEGHLGIPRPLARTSLNRVASSLRGYFVGVTVVALWSALIVGLGALVIGVPLAATIAVVTFVGGYVPYLGAWAAGVFAVLIALGGAGPEEAAAMIVIVLLANGLLQQLVQPIAYGAALDLHPLAVLIVTIAGGCLFGTVGLVLAAPLLSAAVKIASDIKARHKSEAPPPPPGEPTTEGSSG